MQFSVPVIKLELLVETRHSAVKTGVVLLSKFDKCVQLWANSNYIYIFYLLL